jgi:hypothetical protein
VNAASEDSPALRVREVVGEEVRHARHGLQLLKQPRVVLLLLPGSRRRGHCERRASAGALILRSPRRRRCCTVRQKCRRVRRREHARGRRRPRAAGLRGGGLPADACRGCGDAEASGLLHHAAEVGPVGRDVGGRWAARLALGDAPPSPGRLDGPRRRRRRRASAAGEELGGGGCGGRRQQRGGVGR